MKDALRASEDPLVKQNWMGYLTFCLVPAVVHRLTMEDMGQSSEAALVTQREADGLGMFFNEDDPMPNI
jgi:RTC4-like domain